MDHREDFDQGDALDERYLIDRAEHEAHAEGNEEFPDIGEDLDEPGPPPRVEPGDVEAPEAPDNLTPAERLGWRIGWERGWLAGRAVANGWTAINATQPATAAPVPTLPQLLDQLTTAAYAWGATAATHGDRDEATLAHKASTDAVRAEILRRIGELADSMTSAILAVTGGRP